MFIFPGSRSGGYQVQRSLRFRASASAYLSRTPGVAGNQTAFSISTWVKLGTLGTNRTIFGAGDATAANECAIYISTSDQIVVNQTTGGSGANYRTTNPVYRDPSAHYHLLVVFDTNNATASDRVIIYINGIRQICTEAVWPQSATSWINTTQPHFFGKYPNSTSYFDGYLSEVRFIDGQVLTPSSFGQFDPLTGQWVAKKYTGTYGTNGFYLDFSDPTSTTTLGADRSGNGNNWTTSGISVTAGVTYDSMLDVPSGNGWADGGNGRGNYCTLNPLAKLNSAPSYSSANLGMAGSGVGGATTAYPSSGKWYLEGQITALNTAITFGICNQSPARSIEISYQNNGNKNAGGVASAYGATYIAGDIIGVAVDCDAQQITFYKNNISQGALAFSISGLSVNDVVFETYCQAAADSIAVNFGQRPFAYTPPSGYKALHTGNLPASTIQQPNKHFDVLTHSGNGGTQNITGLQFQPDLVWVKSRANANGHVLQDAARGFGSATKLASNATTAENGTAGVDTDPQWGYITGALSNGFSVTIGPGTGDQINRSGYTYVDWLWKAGGAAVTNNAGTISSQVSANAAAGFSIATYSNGAVNGTVGHGLGVAPKMVIIKRRGAGTNTPNWVVFHSMLSGGVPASSTLLTLQNSNVLTLNTTNAVGAYTADDQIVGAASGYIAYCFAEIPGFSKFGSYTGNGSADGPFIYCGFRPKYVMWKRVDAAAGWYVNDGTRSVTNPTNLSLQPNTSGVEYNAGGNEYDFTSNGFKLRTLSAEENASGGTYIFAAFAESPFNYSNAR